MAIPAPRSAASLLLALALSAGVAQAAECHHPHRSHAARSEFQRLHPCPATGMARGKCPGYVVDHIIALKRCGPDEPDNMQWQTIEDARSKDRHE